MKRGNFVFITLLCLLSVSQTLPAQESKTQKEFRPVTIIDGLDKPEGMAVIGDALYVSQYNENGSIIKYDLANKFVSGKLIGGLNYPTGLLAFEDKLIVLEYGTGSMFMVDPENGQKELMASGFSRPADVILHKDNLFVSDYGRGMIYQVNPENFEKSVFASGLSTPAGMTVFKDNIHVVEWGMGRISKIYENGKKEYLVTEGLSSPWGLMVYQNEMYVAENGSDQISRIKEFKIPVENGTAEAHENDANSSRDSITVYRAVSMNCSGLDHPEAFSVSERGIYISEWKSKEVSEIRLNSPPTGELVLTGKSKLGNTIVAEPKNIQDGDGLGPFSYRWQIADHPESATWNYLEGDKTDYKLKKANQVGKYIRAELSYTDQKGFDEHIFSDAKLIIKSLAPEVLLTYSPDDVFLTGDTVTLSAELIVMDEDARRDKVEFYSGDIPLITVTSPPYSYKFVVQDNETKKGYLDHLSIRAKGFDSNGLFGEDEKTIYVTNEQELENELRSWLHSAGEDISIFPNPATDVLNILYKKGESFSIRLIDINNKVVLSTVISNGSKVLNISKLKPGIYILEYTIGSETKAEKFVKL